MTWSPELLDRLRVVRGDITVQDVDAIVNAANPSLLGGGGVDGAIHRAAGPRLLEECRTFGGCPHGEARITGGYRLPAKYVIHTPGPIYRGGAQGEREILASSYRNAMRLAQEQRLRSIAFPSISTGVYGYPLPEACDTALQTVLAFMEAHSYHPEVRFVLFDEATEDVYRQAVARLYREGEG